jgi:fructose-specific phosphotransferase system IIC component
MSPVPGHFGKKSLYGKKKRNLANEREDAKRWMIVSCVIMLCGAIVMAMGNPAPSISAEMADHIFQGGIALLVLGAFIFLWNAFILAEMNAANR